jgi:hypothetical protein
MTDDDNKIVADNAEMVAQLWAKATAEERKDLLIAAGFAQFAVQNSTSFWGQLPLTLQNKVILVLAK